MTPLGEMLRLGLRTSSMEARALLSVHYYWDFQVLSLSSAQFYFLASIISLDSYPV